MLERLRAHIPTREQIVGNRWLRWLAPYLGHPKLWHWSRRGVALGVAIGVFFGLLIPVAQIPLAATVEVVMRANLPAAAASTQVTNPVTFAPVYYAAYRVGAWVTGEPANVTPPSAAARNDAADISILQLIAPLGLPLIVGMAITATLAGLMSYLLISCRLVLARQAEATPAPATIASMRGSVAPIARNYRPMIGSRQPVDAGCSEHRFDIRAKSVRERASIDVP